MESEDSEICNDIRMDWCFKKITKRCICAAILTFSKYSLSVINCFVMVFGLVMLAVAGLAYREEALLSQTTLSPSPPPDPSLFMLVLGCLLVPVGALGCVAPLRNNVTLLRAFSASAMVLFVVEVAGGVLTFVYLRAVERSVAAFLVRAIQAYEQSDRQRHIVDYVQKKYSCCGALSFDDWESNEYYACASLSHTHCSVPASCCRVRANVQCGFQSRGYGEGYAAHYIHTRGCVHSVLTEIRLYFIAVGSIALTVGFVELFGLVISGILVHNILVAKNSSRSDHVVLTSFTRNKPDSNDSTDFDHSLLEATGSVKLKQCTTPGDFANGGTKCAIRTHCKYKPQTNLDDVTNDSHAYLLYNDDTCSDDTHLYEHSMTLEVHGPKQTENRHNTDKAIV